MWANADDVVVVAVVATIAAIALVIATAIVVGAGSGNLAVLAAAVAVVALAAPNTAGVAVAVILTSANNVVAVVFAAGTLGKRSANIVCNNSKHTLAPQLKQTLQTRAVDGKNSQLVLFVTFDTGVTGSKCYSIESVAAG